MRELFIQATYLTASILFILGLKSLTRPDKARHGMNLAAIGMLVAVIGTLMNHEIVRYDWIIGGLVIGVILGIPMGIWVPMTAMPQRIAISHLFGALAATLVGVAIYYHEQATLSSGHMVAIGFEVLFGSLTVTGSFIAFGKLQEILPGHPMTYRGQNAVNLTLFAGTLGMFGYLIYNPQNMVVFYAMIAAALLIGVLLVLPIGGADMPVVISLLNSYAGLASAATGFAIGNNVLIIVGALDGGSGFLLSILMSRAMNRSFGNILFGAFGSGGSAATKKSSEGQTAIPILAEDAAIQIAYAQRIVIIPGYGLAVAQAQHQVRELADVVERNGGEVRYAIHPVAGRMPGHMNVLLAEANIPYDRLITDLDEANALLERTDIALVIGANDTVNPAAVDDPSSPIYGMPIVRADLARKVLVLKRSMASGFAGIENELFYRPNTNMLFGDAKVSLNALLAAVKEELTPAHV
jgi:NAD(P) transhydrogenase subunit beta